MSVVRVKITEYLEVDLERESWVCSRCEKEIGSARKSYKQGCLIYDRDPREIFRPIIEGEQTYAPDPDWCRFVEFYCPSCGTMIECEALPPGHPLTHDIQLDLEDLRARYDRG